VCISEGVLTSLSLPALAIKTTGLSPQRKSKDAEAP
jgi:hypothetical protein